MVSKLIGLASVTPEQRAEQRIDALRTLYDQFIDQLREIVRTEIAAALEGKSEAIGVSDAATINTPDETKEIFT